MPPAPGASSWEPLVIFFTAGISIIFFVISVCCLINILIFHRNLDLRRLRVNEDNDNGSSLQIHSHGLESSIMHSLPISQFSRMNKEPGMDATNSECGVCLGEFEEGEWLKHLPNCSHGFHVACIDTWFQTHSNCPLCRSSVCEIIFPHECSVSVYPVLLEALRREDTFRERATHDQTLHAAAVLHNPIN